VRVGERLLVDLIVHNTSAADITYVVGSSSCPDFGRAIAGLTDDPQGPTDWAGNPMVGSHASIKDLVATGNQLTNVWYLAPEADQDAMAESGQRACTADLRTDVIGAGASVSKTVAFDAAVAPGPLERTTITIDYVFEYWPDSAGAAIGDAATRQAATATTSVGLVDDPVRNERLADVYALIDADPRVREVLDASADQQYLVWAGYRHGVLRFRLMPFLMAPGSGGRLALLDVDPARVEIVSFSYPDP